MHSSSGQFLSTGTFGRSVFGAWCRGNRGRPIPSVVSTSYHTGLHAYVSAVQNTGKCLSFHSCILHKYALGTCSLRGRILRLKTVYKDKKIKDNDKTRSVVWRLILGRIYIIYIIYSVRVTARSPKV